MKAPAWESKPRPSSPPTANPSPSPTAPSTGCYAALHLTHFEYKYLPGSCCDHFTWVLFRQAAQSLMNLTVTTLGDIGLPQIGARPVRACELHRTAGRVHRQ